MPHPAPRPFRFLWPAALAAVLACHSQEPTAAKTPTPPNESPSPRADDPASGQGRPGDSPAARSPAPAPDRQAACAQVPDWRGEVIPLPPEFAPSLPPGLEELRFAPGMFKPDADDYFTYAFVLAFDGEPDLGAAGLQSILDAYFRGLMAAVAKSKKIEVPVDRIATRVTAADSGFRARASIYDAFTSGAALQLDLELAVAGSCVKVKASPQPRDHAVWQALGHAVNCLSCTITR